jgi:hypothetical protein
MMKLAPFNKILIATGTINYMAEAINGVMTAYNYNPSPDVWRKEAIDQQQELLEDVVSDLKGIMGKLGNYINATDCICAIDQYVTVPAFHVILGGYDDTEGEFPTHDYPYDKSRNSLHPVKPNE